MKLIEQNIVHKEYLKVKMLSMLYSVHVRIYIALLLKCSCSQLTS